MSEVDEKMLQVLNAETAAIKALGEILMGSLQRSAAMRRADEPGETVTVFWRPLPRAYGHE